MSRNALLFLFLCGLAVALFVSAFQPMPGYMDADYYYMGGQRLADGHGFSEMILWNYLDDPAGFPHPSHGYWMPLASILAAAGLSLSPQSGLPLARSGFILIAGFIPPLTASLAYSINPRRDLALVAGFLAVFGGFYVQYLATTDTFVIYMLLGGLFFLFCSDNLRKSLVFPPSKYQTLNIAPDFVLGLLAGLMHLSRADGALWLVIAYFAIFLVALKSGGSKIAQVLLGWFVASMGYLLIMLPWFWRNWSVFGTILAPGGSHAFWLTDYNQLFAYPATRLTMENWLASGWQSILSVRWEAFIWNLQTTLGVQGMIFLLPFIFVALWQHRSERRVLLGVLAWLFTFGAMTVIFPLAGSRGGFLHSGAALQPLWWALAPAGVERAIVWAGEKRGWNIRQARPVFLTGSVLLAVLLSAAIFFGRVAGEPGWGAETMHYAKIEAFLHQNAAPEGAPVIVANPPGYFIVSGRPAMAVPDGDEQTIHELAQRYGAKYLILESDAITSGLVAVYQAGESLSSMRYLGEVDGSKIFEIP